MSLVPFDPKNEGSVLTLLEVAASWLAEAVHRGEPEQVALVKAQLATAAEATKQLNLSKEIQLDAQEMVRRAEYALGKAIRRGQEEGTIGVEHDHGGPATDYVRNGKTVKVGDRLREPKPISPHIAAGMTSPSTLTPIYTMSDDIEPDDFDDAIDAAKAEGNLSRNNVIRKIKDKASVGPMTREGRAALIGELAEQGYSSRQMPTKVGVTEETVREIARAFDIDIPADRSIRRTRRVNSTDVVIKTATALEGLVMGIDLIDYDDVDPREACQWATSLNDSLRVLNRFAKQIKEMTHD